MAEQENVRSALVKTGIAGLDDVLLGGVNRNNIVLVEGAPGTGKTTLGLEFIYRGALDYDEPGLIVSFELSPQKLLRDAAGFGWDFERLREQGLVNIVYTVPAVLLDDLQSPEGVLASEVRRMGAKRVLIDGLGPLRLFGERESGRPFRESLHILVETLQRLDVTAILTNEAGENPAAGPPSHERFVCDTIITLSARSDRRRSLQRTLEIPKSRGQGFITGIHTLRIEAGRGVEIYRRTPSVPSGFTEQPSSDVRGSTGNRELDGMLGGGLYEGSNTLLVGISGTGKTVTSIQFLMEGVARGETGLLVTLDEHPAQMVRNAESLGFPLGKAIADGHIHILYDSPLEVNLDVHYERIRALAEEEGVKRVVLDSLAAYEATLKPGATDFLYALATFFKNRLSFGFFNYESPELLGVSQISEDLKVSHLVDNIILLNYVEVSTRLRRAISVPKARGSANSQTTREFSIEEGGLRILEDPSLSTASVPQLPFSSYYNLLSRAPARTSPVIEEQIAEHAAGPREH